MAHSLRKSNLLLLTAVILLSYAVQGQEDGSQKQAEIQKYKNDKRNSVNNVELKAKEESNAGSGIEALELTRQNCTEKGVKPEGSTGCSKKFTNGYCWRYCKGSSGYWCYTKKDCTLDEESCAYYDSCGARGCLGADPGCVTQCC